MSKSLVLRGSFFAAKNMIEQKAGNVTIPETQLHGPLIPLTEEQVAGEPAETYRRNPDGRIVGWRSYFIDKINQTPSVATDREDASNTTTALVPLAEISDDTLIDLEALEMVPVVFDRSESGQEVVVKTAPALPITVEKTDARVEKATRATSKQSLGVRSAYAAQCDKKGHIVGPGRKASKANKRHI